MFFPLRPHKIDVYVVGNAVAGVRHFLQTPVLPFTANLKIEFPVPVAVHSIIYVIDLGINESIKNQVFYG